MSTTISQLETLMREWLATGTASQKAHAAVRLALPFDPPPPALPGPARMAANLIGAVVSHAAAGMPAVDDAAYAARLRACETCPNLRLPDWRCAGERGCGCYLKTKARWAEQKCPLGKWEE